MLNDSSRGRAYWRQGNDGEAGYALYTDARHIIVDSRRVTVRDLVIDGDGHSADGVKVLDHADFAHYITLTDLTIRNLKRHQQIAGISTRAPARGWVVRDNEIRGAGIGMHFGNSDGTAPFVDALIEHNLVIDSIGYAMRIEAPAAAAGKGGPAGGTQYQRDPA